MIRISFVAITTFLNILIYIASRHGAILQWEATIRVLTIISGTMLVFSYIVKIPLKNLLKKDDLTIGVWADILSFIIAIAIFKVVQFI